MTAGTPTPYRRGFVSGNGTFYKLAATFMFDARDDRLHRVGQFETARGHILNLECANEPPGRSWGP
jgi:hypothetical protein